MKVTITPLQLSSSRGKTQYVYWASLLLGLLLLAIASKYYFTYRQTNEVLIERQQALSKAVSARVKADRISAGNRATVDSGKNPEVTILNLLGLSWEGAMDAIERAGHAVDDSVVLSSLSVSKASFEQLSFSLMGLAVDSDALMEYLAALKEDPRTIRVFLVSQRESSSGKLMLTRFQIELVIDPRIQRASPESEVVLLPPIRFDDGVTQSAPGSSRGIAGGSL